MNAEEIIGEYQVFKQFTEQMLENIKKNEWNGVADLSERRERVLKELMAFDDTLITDPSERMRWSDLIRQCLEMNTTMQTLVEEKMAELQNRFLQEKRLLQTYHPHSE